MTTHGIVLLAAGASTRMGSPKQLLPYAGQPLIRHAAEQALAAGTKGVVVVLGANAGHIRPALDGLAVTIAENPRWEEGMGTSIQTGVRAAEALGWDGLILTLADLPRVGADIYHELAERHAQTQQPIVTAAYAGTVGVPVYFTREFFPRLLALAPSQGCKGVILAHDSRACKLPCPAAEFDLDTPADYAAVSENAGPESGISLNRT